MKRKTLLILIIALAMISILLTTDIFAEQKEPFKVVLVTGIATNPFFITMDAGARTAAKELGIDYEYQGPPTYNHVEQLTLLRTIVARGDIDGIIISPCDGDASIEPLTEIWLDLGIPILCTDTTVGENDIEGLPLITVTSDNFTGGKIAGETLAKLIGGKGKVGVFRSSAQLTTDRARYDGFMEAISEYPDIKLVAEEFAEEQTSVAATQVQTIISAHPDLAGVFGLTTPVSHGVAIGVDVMGKKGKIAVVGFDAQPAQAQDVKDGITQSLIAQAPYMMGYLGMQLMNNYLLGFIDSYPSTILTGFKIITKENVEDSDVQSWLYREKFLKFD